MRRLLVEVRGRMRTSNTGAKAASLSRLMKLGYAVPRAWAISGDSVEQLGRDLDALSPSIVSTLHPSATYAVRSSSAAEDQASHSYAGRFSTVLGVPSSDVPEAIVAVGLASGEERVVAYADAIGAAAPGEAIPVIVQEMVDALVAGVVFSRNPVTGIRETVIEAVAGNADDLLSGRAQPERWVRKLGHWLLTPDTTQLPEQVADAIADGAERLERALGYSVDAEWAWDGRLWWLQCRPVTAGAQAAVYSSRLARDMLPGIVLPLVWTINGPVNSSAFVRFLEDVFGPLGVDPDDLAALFHYRMYINIGALSRLFAEFGLPEESLELLAGMERGASMPRMPRPTPRSIRRVPHFVRAFLRFSRFGRELEHDLPALWTQSREFAALPDPSSADASELLERMARLRSVVSETSYRHLVALMVMQMYSMRLRGALESTGAIAKGETLQLPCPDASENDVGRALDGLAELARVCPRHVTELVRAGDLGGLREEPAASAFLERFDDFMRRFGHLSDSGVNFAAVAWSERPEAVLQMACAHLETLGAGRASQSCEQFARTHRLNYRQRRALRRAVAYQAYRDRTGELNTFAYGLIRPHVLALGRHLVRLGALVAPDDVFLLTLDEVERVVTGSLSGEEARAITAQRAEEVAFASEGTPPEVVVGDVAELVRMPTRRVLRGHASSRGRYTGRVVVCQGAADLHRIEVGDVVVVPFSDASWTPLFTRAGAIVAESGGLLSHSAILARELGVPAVVSVRGALSLQDGSLVSVDGFAGTVTIVEREDGE